MGGGLRRARRRLAAPVGPAVGRRRRRDVRGPGRDGLRRGRQRRARRAVGLGPGGGHAARRSGRRGWTTEGAARLRRLAELVERSGRPWRPRWDAAARPEAPEAGLVRRILTPRCPRRPPPDRARVRSPRRRGGQPRHHRVRSGSATGLRAGRSGWSRRSTSRSGAARSIMACGAARLGLRVAIVGVVGDDVFGRFMLDAMRDRGVDVSAVRVDPGTPTGATVILSNGRDRAILTAPGTIGAVTADDVPAGLLARARHLHIGSWFLQAGLQPGAGGLLAAARGAGLTTSIDPNWDPDGRLGLGPAGAAVRARPGASPTRPRLTAIAGIDDVEAAAVAMARLGADGTGGRTRSWSCKRGARRGARRVGRRRRRAGERLPGRRRRHDGRRRRLRCRVPRRVARGREPDRRAAAGRDQRGPVDARASAAPTPSRHGPSSTRPWPPGRRDRRGADPAAGRRLAQRRHRQDRRGRGSCEPGADPSPGAAGQPCPGGKALNAVRAARTPRPAGRCRRRGRRPRRVRGSRSELDARGIHGWLVRVEGETRTCLSVLDRQTGELTEFYEAGIVLPEDRWPSVEDRARRRALAVDGRTRRSSCWRGRCRRAPRSMPTARLARVGR